MRLHTTGLHNLLREKPGRYIYHHHGDYVVKEADGSDVTVTENGVTYPLRPPEIMIDDLVGASLLIREPDGSKYRPR